MHVADISETRNFIAAKDKEKESVFSLQRKKLCPLPVKGCS